MYYYSVVLRPVEMLQRGLEACGDVLHYTTLHHTTLHYTTLQRGLEAGGDVTAWS